MYQDPSVTSDAAAAVAKVGGSNISSAVGSSPPRQHDPNLHPSLAGHDTSDLVGDSSGEAGQGAGDDVMEEDEEGEEDEEVSEPKPVANTPSKERNSLTLDQRRALRRWANAQDPRPSHKACIQWFHGQYGLSISQSTVSHSLSPKYSRLDAVPGDNHQLSGSRLRFGNWPDIERMVLMWYQQVQATGRNPTNEELGEKAKMIFASLPRYRDEKPPEFSPGWIHRFKKRYGLLVRRHRRSGPLSPQEAHNLSEDINYLAEHVPRYLAISPETSPTAIKETAQRTLGVDPTVHTCALVRDEIVRRQNGAGQQDESQGDEVGEHDLLDAGSSGEPMYVDDTSPQQHDHHAAHHTTHHQQHQPHAPADGLPNPELVLQEQIRLIQQEHAAAEANAAAVRAQHDRAAGIPLGAHSTGPGSATGSALATPSRPGAMQYTGMEAAHNTGLALTPINPNAVDPAIGKEQPIRCPFCLNQRMLRTIKEAVEHLSTHVIV
jgi:hypothetical protein